jgi:hypothetical protein
MYVYRKVRGLVRRLKSAVVMLSKPLEAVLLHSASRAIEVERLSALYESLAFRVAALEQVTERRPQHDPTVIEPDLPCD